MSLYAKWVNLPVTVTGDLVFFKDSKSKVSFLIRLMSTLRGEGPTFANHVGVIAWSSVVCEALAEGVKFHELVKKYAKPRYEVAIFRSLEVGAGDQVRIAKAIQHYRNKKYGKAKLAAHAVDWFLSAFTGWRWDVYAARRLCRMDRYPICSWLVAWVYKRAGVPFKADPRKAQPDDLMDEVEADPDWVCIWRTD